MTTDDTAGLPKPCPAYKVMPQMSGPGLTYACVRPEHQGEGHRWSRMLTAPPSWKEVGPGAWVAPVGTPPPPAPVPLPGRMQRESRLLEIQVLRSAATLYRDAMSGQHLDDLPHHVEMLARDHGSVEHLLGDLDQEEYAITGEEKPEPLAAGQLYGADPNCAHEVVDAPGGGIVCTRCKGWYCA